jgi:hypothetical protein
MPWAHYLAAFLAGAFTCNALPHLTGSLGGAPFPTPFAKPPGKGDSTPVVNFLWSVANLIVGLVLLDRSGLSMGLNLAFGLFSLGFVLMGISLSHHFGKVWRDKQR